MRTFLTTILYIHMTFICLFVANANQKSSQVIALFGSDSEDAVTYQNISGKSLSKSEFAILFMRPEGFPEKEIVQKYREVVPLKASKEIDFDVRVTERYAFILGRGKYALLFENTFEEYSKKKLADLVQKDEKELLRQALPEEPLYEQTSFTYYDLLGNILMNETKKGCAGIGALDHNDPLSQGQVTFAISDNGERFSFCYSCNNPEGVDCNVYSPLRQQSLKLAVQPYFNRTTSFSPNARYFVFYHQFGQALTFVDLETKISAQITWPRPPGLLKAFDDGTFVVAQGDGKEVYYDLQGQLVRKFGGK